MWNSDRSLTLSIICVRIFILIGIVFLFAGYPIAKMYVDYIHQKEALYPILIAGYICLILAFFMFYELLKLLKNIRHEEVFIPQNIACLRTLSWLCMAVAIVTFTAVLGYVPFLLVAVVFAFIALILRVVKNVMAQAMLLKQENDFTI